MLSNFIRKYCTLLDNMGKYCRAEQATDDNMVRGFCMLVTLGHKHTQNM